MKKFITYVSLQTGRNLQKINYESVDNVELKSDRAVRFPISILVNTYAEKGEDVEIICVIEKGNDSSKENENPLKDEINQIAQEKGFQPSYKEIEVAKDERAESHLDTFRKLIEIIKDEDELFACITYGTKPFPILEMMALNYAYQIRTNISVRSVVYGKVNWSRERDEEGRSKIESAYIYEISALFFMTQIMNSLSERKVENPDEIIEKILKKEA